MEEENLVITHCYTIYSLKREEFYSMREYKNNDDGHGWSNQPTCVIERESLHRLTFPQLKKFKNINEGIQLFLFKDHIEGEIFFVPWIQTCKIENGVLVRIYEKDKVDFVNSFILEKTLWNS